MISATDYYKLVQNVIANGGGIENVDLASEVSKTMAFLNKTKSTQDVNQARAISNAPIALPQSPQGTMSSQATQSMPQDPNAVNQPQNEGQGALNLPPQM